MIVPATAVFVELYVWLFNGLVNWPFIGVFVEKSMYAVGRPLSVWNWTLSLSPKVFAWASTALTWPGSYVPVGTYPLVSKSYDESNLQVLARDLGRDPQSAEASYPPRYLMIASNPSTRELALLPSYISLISTTTQRIEMESGFTWSRFETQKPAAWWQHPSSSWWWQCPCHPQ